VRPSQNNNKKKDELFFFFGPTRVWTQGFTLATRHYTAGTTPPVHFALVWRWGRLEKYLPQLVLNYDFDLQVTMITGVNYHSQFFCVLLCFELWKAQLWKARFLLCLFVCLFVCLSHPVSQCRPSTGPGLRCLFLYS
jgi:hypothetical protein